MEEVIAEMLKMMQEFEKNDELFDTGARLMRKMYHSLVKVGFSPDEAIQIVAAQGFGVVHKSS